MNKCGTIQSPRSSLWYFKNGLVSNTERCSQSQQNWWNSDRNNATASQSHLAIYPPQIFSKLYTLKVKRKGRITEQTVTQGD